MPANELRELTDLVCRFVAEASLSASAQRMPSSLRGPAWRRGRFGHPEGRVGLHVAPILARIGGYARMRV